MGKRPEVGVPQRVQAELWNVRQDLQCKLRSPDEVGWEIDRSPTSN